MTTVLHYYGTFFTVSALIMTHNCQGKSIVYFSCDLISVSRGLSGTSYELVIKPSQAPLGGDKEPIQKYLTSSRTTVFLNGLLTTNSPLHSTHHSYHSESHLVPLHFERPDRIDCVLFEMVLNCIFKTLSMHFLFSSL